MNQIFISFFVRAKHTPFFFARPKKNGEKRKGGAHQALRRTTPLAPSPPCGARIPSMFCLFFCFVLAGCVSVGTSQNVSSSSSAVSSVAQLPLRTVFLISPDGTEVKIRAEIAQTSEEHSRGLMGRTSLNADAGMLFIFQSEQLLSFWMKNTLIPLDVLFFDAEGNFVSGSEMQPCTADPCPNFHSTAPAFYALEVNTGFGKKYNVSEGWTLQIGE